MSDSYVQLQVPLGPIKPPWAKASRNNLWDDAREAFTAGDLEWDPSFGFLCRLFDTNWSPDFTTPTLITQVPPAVWITQPVALQGVAHARGGYCRALGVRFAAVLAPSRQIGGVAIYIPNGNMVWAAVDWIGNPPLMQDVYVVWPEEYGGPFRV